MSKYLWPILGWLAFIVWLSLIPLLVAVGLDLLIARNTPQFAQVVNPYGSPTAPVQVSSLLVPLIPKFVDADELPVALMLLGRISDDEERAVATEDLVRTYVDRMSVALPASVNPDEQEANRQKWKEKTQKDLDAIFVAVGLLPASQNRLMAMLSIAHGYLVLGDTEKHSRIISDSANEVDNIQKLTKVHWYNRIWAWFKPYFSDKIALTVCGIMALLFYLGRPTARVAARAIARGFYAKSKNPLIRDIMQNSPP